ncbi:carbohydrate ABC transporter permease [Dongia soli]|uniref:Sugar ABC transporter permease n=1 Tax=Dongia soli TaxID=600628 RepID=A0ABU5EET9_9PROT|nr:sugar ABC transporter permease [Dongia soli]MDY0884452.1 sugar ABC transporter permease [Dongia soli]
MASVTMNGSEETSRQIDRWTFTGWKFATPGLTVLAIVMGIPLIYAVVLAMSSFTLLHPRVLPFVGFDNFLSVMDDEYFWHSLWLTIKYSAIAVICEFLLGLGVALMLNRVVKFKAIYFAILTIPMAMSPVSVGLIWHMLLQPNLGIVNELLVRFGFDGVDWLGSSDLAFWTVIFVDVWQQVSFVILILAAGLASLPKDPYEAAEVDGATDFQQFWYLTLPMLRPVATIAIIIQLINEFRTYDLVYVLTKGGPGVATDLLSFFAYKKAFLGLGINEGAATSFALLFLVLILTIAFFRVISRRA